MSRACHLLIIALLGHRFKECSLPLRNNNSSKLPGTDIGERSSITPSFAFKAVTMLWILISVIAFSTVPLGSKAEVCFSDYCEFHLTISFGMTMSDMDDGEAVDELSLSNGCLHQKSKLPLDKNCLQVGEEPTLAAAWTNFKTGGKSLLTTDGYRRRVILVNGQFPGPTLEVGLNSQVVVHVKNDLATVATSVHWHGMTMKETPWMDGVSFLTQCPILPHQTFTYYFKASPAGTHWYHSHMGSQRRDGLNGLFIVHKTQPTMPAFPLLVDDWFHAEGFSERSSDLRLLKDGEESSPVTALINGRKGLPGTGQSPQNLKETMAVFRVNQGKEYRFHTLNVAADLPFEISVDNHQLVVVALDGIDIVPVTVDSFVVHAGERVDFVLRADQPVGRYWLRSNTVEIQPGEEVGSEEEEGGEEEDPEAFKIKAIILYDGLENGTPTSMQECTQSKPCLLLNCAFPPPPATNKICIPLADVRSRKPLAKELGQGAKVVDRFFNIGDNWHDSINARRHIQPTSPLYPSGEGSDIVDCDKVCTKADQGCECTHIVNLPFDETIQIVFTNLEPPFTGLHPGHPMHIHGHHFAVVAQGFAVFNETNGLKAADSPDVKCDSPFCRYIFWTKTPPPLNLVDPPLKDTVIVPPGGYVVIRLRSNNPGFWFVHCHLLFDMVEGMALILKVSPELAPPPPKRFPRCLPFTTNTESLMDGTSENGGESMGYNSEEDEDEGEDESQKRTDMKATKYKDNSREDGRRQDMDIVESGGNNKAMERQNQSDDNLRMSVADLVGIILGSVSLGAVLVGIAILCYLWCSASKNPKEREKTTARF